MRISPSAESNGQRGRRTFLIPSIPDVVFAGLAWLQVAAASVMLLNRDGDLPRHIAVGKVMLESHSLVRQDFFSHTAYGRPFLAYEWLSQLILAAVYEWAGLDAVAVLAAIAIALAYALIAGFLIRRGVVIDLVLVTVAAAALLGMTHWAARPHAFSFAASAILLRLLEPGKRRRLLLFVPLFALWANLHPGFLFGLGVLGLVTLGDILEGIAGGNRAEWWRAARYHGAALGVGSAATLLNPYGLGLHAHSLGHLGNSEIIPGIIEFSSPDFHSVEGLAFLGILLVTLAAVAARRTRLTAPTLLILLATLALSLHSRRYIALFGIVTLPLIALSIAEDWKRWVPGMFGNFAQTLAYGDRLARRGGLALAVVALLGLAVTDYHGHRTQYVATEFSRDVFPVDAVNFARTAGVTGKLYNEYMWGGYITLAWPEQRVAIDGFADFYGTQIFREFFQVAWLDPGWRDVLRRWNVGLVLMRADSRLADELGGEPGWHEVYRDHLAVLLQKSGAAPPQSAKED
jgi:hypothetical protein